MADVKEHYDRLLAEYYSWMSGGFSEKLQQNQKFFSSHHVRAAHSGIAIDLGAGCGFQSIPLSQIGFNVIAIDSSKKLLAELRQNAQGLAIRTINDDLLNFDRCYPGPIELVARARLSWLYAWAIP
jgi:2-polyprenyl-3-methyl-5-hydroxy-6-metoxy-1,4-benzoquinol methylase